MGNKLAGMFFSVVFAGMAACGPDPEPPTKHYFFITSLTYSGDLKTAGGGSSGLEGADNICKKHAAAGDLSGKWKAWISDSSTNAIDRISDVGPWYFVGTDYIVFKNKTNLTTLPLRSITFNEQGINTHQNMKAWTGTVAGGMKTPDTCKDWTSAGEFENGMASGNWTTDYPTRCKDDLTLYCIQQ